MSLRLVLLLMAFPVVHTLGNGPIGVPTPASDAPEKLRQTGQASGHLRDAPKEQLCERAEERAWNQVWASCPKSKQVEEAVTSNCITTDYISDPTGDRGPKLAVEIHVEYRCQ